MRDFLKALALFMGTIIGVGVFGLPYVASKAGFFIVVFYFILISFFVIITDLIFGEVCLNTKGFHRLPGYVEKYLGKNWKKFSFFTSFFLVTGACLAYMIVGGKFLFYILGPVLGGESSVYSLLFFALGSYLVFRGVKTISQIELSLLIVLFAILITFFLEGFSFVNIDYLKNIDLTFLALPYGVVLFSLTGLCVIPELKEMLNNRIKLRKVIVSGVLISMLTYLLFTFIIFSVSGSVTSKDALSGFVSVVGDGTVKIGFVFGIIACFTSFISLGLTLKKTLWYDIGLPKNISWLIFSLLPLSFFLLGFSQFIEIIALTGAVAIGSEAIIVIFLYKAFLEEKKKKFNSCFYLIPLFFCLGIICQIFYLLN